MLEIKTPHLYLKHNMTAVLIAAAILLQNPIWPLWDYTATPAWCAIILLIFSRFHTCLTWHYGLKDGLILFSAIIGFIILPILTGFNYSNILYVGVIIIAITIRQSDFVKALNIVTYCVAIIVAISLPFWLAWKYGGRNFLYMSTLTCQQ